MRLAIENPAAKGELRIFNQFTETFTVNELANRVKRAGHALGLEVDIQHMANPRIEAEEHYYNPKHTGLLDLGLTPNFLTEGVLHEMMAFVTRHRENIITQRVLPRTTWG